MQLRLSNVIKSSFYESFKKKYNFDEYTNQEKPAFFSGVYRQNDRFAIKCHRGPMIVQFAGHDAFVTSNIRRLRKYTKRDWDRVTVIATSKWIENDLKKQNIPCERVSTLRTEAKMWSSNVEKLGEFIYWYKADNEDYGAKIFNKIKKAFPNTEIITTDEGDWTKEELIQIYKECFVSIRPTKHDGSSNTAAEMGLMGRLSIWNNPTPYSIGFKDADDIIRIVKNLQKGYDYKKIARETKEYFEDNENKLKRIIKEKEEQYAKNINKYSLL